MKKKKKKHKTSVPLKNLIFACFGNHEQEPSSIHWVEQSIISVLGKLSLRYGFVVLSILNLALLGRKPNFCENTFSHLFIYLFLFHFLFGSKFLLLLFRVLGMFNVFVQVFQVP